MKKKAGGKKKIMRRIIRRRISRRSVLSLGIKEKTLRILRGNMGPSESDRPRFLLGFDPLLGTDVGYSRVVNPEPSAGNILETYTYASSLPTAPRPLFVSIPPSNIIKESLVAPESSWPYASPHTIQLLQTPNHLKTIRITLESLSNHT